MAISLVANTGKGGTGSSVTSDAIDTSGASLIVVLVSYFTVTVDTDSISDSQTNSWTQGNIYGSSFKVTAFYCSSPSTSASHTFTISESGSYPTILVLAFSGTKTSSPLDQQAGDSNNTPGSLTPSQDGCVLITGYVNGGTVASVDSGYTHSDRVAYSVGTYMGGGAAYLIQGSAAAKDPAWTGGGGANATNHLVFLPEAAAGNPYYAYAQQQ